MTDENLVTVPVTRFFCVFFSCFPLFFPFSREKTPWRLNRGVSLRIDHMTRTAAFCNIVTGLIVPNSVALRSREIAVIFNLLKHGG